MSSANRSGDRPVADVNRLVVSMLEGSRWPMVLVASDLQLVWANRAAREELEAGLSFSLTDGRLSLRSDADDDRFRQFLTNCDEKDQTFTHSSEADDPVLARCRLVCSENEQHVYSLSFFRPSEKPESIDPPLAVLFGLTATEERILSMLGQGSTADCVAAELGVSIATVRKHISNAYGTIGVRSREELFARLRAYS